MRRSFMRFPMGVFLPKIIIVGARKGGCLSPIDKVPIVGNVMGMTLKEYIKTGASDIPQLAYALGVSEHAVHKWVYGQRSPSLENALEIVKLTGGAVPLELLVKSRSAA